MPVRQFLPWSRPVLPAAVDYLTADAHGPSQHTIALVPTAEAGRRLREALLPVAGQAGLPHIITPEQITQWTLKDLPSVATSADLLLTWMQVLQYVSLEDYQNLFPVPPVSRDTGWARSTAAELLRLRHRLEEGRKTIADTANRLGPGHPEAGRWRDLAKIEALAAAALKRSGMTDPVLARLSASSRPAFPPGVTRIVLLAVPDPVHLVIAALENAEAAGMRIEVLVHADSDCAHLFDAWGRPLPELWTERVIDIPEPNERICLKPRPDEEAGAMVETL
ncbi:MAG TPA: hypothetical protein VHM91_22710, partial [Verrucomicrobiales bacterium]|nr:hypothetical protein [Verrucomicrobiales bacterium]